MLSKSIVDWVSFSLAVYADSDVRKTTFVELGHALPEWERVVGSMDFVESKGRPPYDRSYRAKGFTVYAAPSVGHIAIEVSGIGCMILRELGLMRSTLATIAHRCSRIDIATDIETTESPTDFCADGYSGRIRTFGQISSDSGETCYVGSQKGDRYCRVYRYKKPHERSHLLRIEYVYRRKQAKQVALKVAELGIDKVAGMSASTYKWGSEIMQNLTVEERLLAGVSHRSNAKTLRWLQLQVAPAIKKLVGEGVIEDLDEFVAKYFKGEFNEG